MADLQLKQADGSVEMSKGNVDKNYEFPTHEEHLVHAELEIRSFNAVTGERTSTPSVQKYYPKEFDQAEADGAFRGYTVNVLHDPRRSKELVKEKEKAGAASPIQSASVDKPLDEMNKAELRIKYAELYKEEADSKESEQSLRDAIEDKIMSLRGTDVMGNMANADERGQGTLSDGVREPSEAAQATIDAQNSIDETNKALAEKKEEEAEKSKKASTRKA